MPTTFKRFAVDFDGDGRRDVVDSVPDVIASTANNLKRDGWVSGQTWGYEVAVPKNFDYMLADRSKQMTVRQWESLGLTRPDGKPFPRVEDRAYLLVPAGAQGPGFLMLQNFRVIMKYNPAEAYALAIGHLADRLRGGGPFVQDWPRSERVLTLTDATNCSSCWRGAATTSVSPTACWAAHPRRHPQFPGIGRTDAGRLCHRLHAGSPAQPLIGANHPAIFKLTFFG